MTFGQRIWSAITSGPVGHLDWLRACVGALLGIGLTAFVCHMWLGKDAGLPYLVAPMGASAVLLFAVPASPLARPWAVFAGNVISTTVGVASSKLLGDPLLAAGDDVLFPFWISDGAWARANRPVIKAWIDALTEAKSYMDANPGETRAVLAKYSRLPPEVVAKVPLPTYRFTIQPDELGIWIDVLRDLGQLSTAIDKASVRGTREFGVSAFTGSPAGRR